VRSSRSFSLLTPHCSRPATSLHRHPIYPDGVPGPAPWIPRGASDSYPSPAFGAPARRLVPTSTIAKTAPRASRTPKRKRPAASVAYPQPPALQGQHVAGCTQDSGSASSRPQRHQCPDSACSMANVQLVRVKPQRHRGPVQERPCLRLAVRPERRVAGHLPRRGVGVHRLEVAGGKGPEPEPGRRDGANAHSTNLRPAGAEPHLPSFTCRASPAEPHLPSPTCRPLPTLPRELEFRP
jgi:hypothetical protein